MQLLEFLWVCYRAYRNTPPNEVTYTALLSHGVPRITIMIARDRKAWELSQFAIAVRAGEL